MLRVSVQDVQVGRAHGTVTPVFPPALAFRTPASADLCANSTSPFPQIDITGAMVIV